MPSETKNLSEEELTGYAAYVKEKSSEIASAVSAKFEESKESIRKDILMEVRRYIKLLPFGAPANMTLVEFLSIPNATLDLEYPTYEAALDEHTQWIADRIVDGCIRNAVKAKFGADLTDDELDGLYDKGGNFREIYLHSLAMNFTWSDFAIFFCGIKDMQLTDIVKAA